MQVTLIERYEQLGGVCLNVGCIPSKALLHIAEVVNEVRELRDKGVDFGEPRFDLERLRAFVDRIVGGLTQGLNTLADRRKITVTVVGPRMRWIDFELKWIAVQDVTVQKTNHSLFSIRAAGDISPWGGGTLINADGQSGEKATFGKPSAWCGYHGRRRNVPGNVVEGIAILDHPQNAWSPCPWFTRDYGFISPTPFNFIKEPWRLPAGDSVTLRYRVVLHAGDHKDADLDAIHEEWAAS